MGRFLPQCFHWEKPSILPFSSFLFLSLPFSSFLFFFSFPYSFAQCAGSTTTLLPLSLTLSWQKNYPINQSTFFLLSHTLPLDSGTTKELISPHSHTLWFEKCEVHCNYICPLYSTLFHFILLYSTLFYFILLYSTLFYFILIYSNLF